MTNLTVEVQAASRVPHFSHYEYQKDSDKRVEDHVETVPILRETP